MADGSGHGEGGAGRDYADRPLDIDQAKVAAFLKPAIRKQRE